MRLIDPPNSMIAPEHWCGLTLLAATTYLEAEGEMAPGQLAVAYVQCTRALFHHVELHKVILGPDGVSYGDGRIWEPFSCWNDDYRAQARKRIDKLQEHPKTWEAIYGIAAGAWWRTLPDPTHGAYYYLNPVLTRQIRPGGELPAWWNIDTDPDSEVTLGSHAFRRRK